MPFEFKSNIDQVLKGLLNKKQATTRGAYLGMKMGGREYEARMISKQMSGRKGNKYLNRQTGNLANGWDVNVKPDVKDFVLRISTDVKYAAIHQYGGKTGRNYSARIPKRLYLHEDFEKSGKDIIKRAIVRQWRQT